MFKADLIVNWIKLARSKKRIFRDAFFFMPDI